MTSRLASGVLSFAVLTSASLIPVAAHAQSATTGAIAGTVRDTTGAVLPGVTVEASSPALIEKSRTAVTDAEGNYKIVDLRPGTYAVTFSLTGFSTVKRDGIELSTGFTANVAGEMKVGSVEETVTVSGQSPIVDIQNVNTQTVLSRTVLDTLPAPQTMMGFATLTLGALAKSSGGAPTVDVGGSKGENTPTLSIHGMRANDMRQLYDGMNANNLASGGGRRSFAPNQLGIQEVVLATGNASAEVETGGMVLNVVPKDGGNAFKGSFNGAYTNEHLQVNNLDDDLRARGLTAASGVKTIYDWGGGLGGRIVADKLWFYTAGRAWGAPEYQAGIFYNKSTNPFVYVADPTRKAYIDNHTWDGGFRLAWQAAPKHKITVSENVQNNCQCFVTVSAATAPDAAGNIHYETMHLIQGSWTYTASNRLLFEAGVSYAYQPLKWTLEQNFPGAIGIRELSIGLAYAGTGTGAFSSSGGGPVSDKGHTNPLNQRFSVSYVGGSHAFKFGEQLLEGFQTLNENVPQQLGYLFLNGRPTNIVQHAGPVLIDMRIQSLSLYGQDQWTLRRLTLNLGVRYDQFVGWDPAGSQQAGPFIPAFSYNQVDNVPNFKDVSPRIGAAYDLFGNGRTAIKGSIGRYLAGLGTELAVFNQPVVNLVQTATRTWNDANANFAPDCDLTNVGANGECGALDNRLFGQPFRNTFYDPSVTEGWGNRGYSWQGSVSIQHELRQGLGINFGYFRTTYGNQTVQQNQLVTAADFTPYCLTAPLDSRLPSGGGNRVCGLYDVSPARFGQVRNLILQSSAFGHQEERFDGFDLGANARFGRGGLLQGGVSLGRQVIDTCYLNDRPDVTAMNYATGQGGLITTPRDPAFCRVSPPWSAGTQYKLNGVYPVPWGFEPSFTFQNLPGGFVSATQAVPNATIAPALGRNLAACGAAAVCTATASVGLVPPATLFLDRFSLLDLRVTKVVKIAGLRVKGMVDLYNVFNDNSVLDVVATFGPAWLRPSSMVGGRLVKFGGQVDF
jgi:hypothetical protein